MTPEQAYALDDEHYAAFVLWMREEVRAQEKAARRKGR